MPSEVEIASTAITKLGAAPITSFDDETDRANLCRDYYPNVRDAVLRAYPWNCAIQRIALALDASAPLFGYDYKFALPTIPYCLRVLETEDDIEFKVEGRFLLCDESSVNIKFIARITDPGLVRLPSGGSDRGQACRRTGIPCDRKPNTRTGYVGPL